MDYTKLTKEELLIQTSKLIKLIEQEKIGVDTDINIIEVLEELIKRYD